MSADVERRDFERVPAEMTVRVSSATGLRLEGRSVNLSINGLYLITNTPLPLGARCRVSLEVKGDDGEHELTIRANVAHVEDGGLGLSFSSLAPEDAEIIDAILRKAQDQNAA